MLMQVKRHILEARVARLKEHVEHVGDSEGFQRALQTAENQLREVEQQKEQDQPREA